MTISLENLRAEYTPWMALRVAAYPDLIRPALTRVRQLRGRSLLRRFFDGRSWNYSNLRYHHEPVPPLPQRMLPGTDVGT